MSPLDHFLKNNDPEKSQNGEDILSLARFLTQARLHDKKNKSLVMSDLLFISFNNIIMFRFSVGRIRHQAAVLKQVLFTVDLHNQLIGFGRIYIQHQLKFLT